MRTFNINNITIGNTQPITLIAGPCQIESQDHAEQTAGTIKEIADSIAGNFARPGRFHSTRLSKNYYTILVEHGQSQELSA